MTALQASPAASRSDPEYVNYRLKILALGLAHASPTHFADLVLDTMLLPGRFDTWMRVSAAELLLFGGATLPADQTLRLLDDLIEESRRWGMQDQQRWLAIRFLCICPFVDSPRTGTDRIRQIASELRLGTWEYRDILPALGQSRFEGSLDLMMDIVSTQEAWRSIEFEWIAALAALDTPNANRTLLGFVDPDLPVFPWVLDWQARERIAQRIATLAATDSALADKLQALSLQVLDESRRDILAKTLELCGTTSAILAIVNLIDDSGEPAVPFSVHRAIERAVNDRLRYGETQGVVTLRASASTSIRSTLFAMTYADRRRQRSAYSLLGEIEEWRVEYGRPIQEPRHPSLESGLPWPPPEPD